MTIRLSVLTFSLLVIYFLLIIHFLKCGKLEQKYSLLWLFTGIVLFSLVLFPKLLEKLAVLVGIYDPMNSLFAFSLVFVLMIVFSLTLIISVMRQQIKQLAQECATYEKRLRDIEERTSTSSLSKDAAISPRKVQK